MPRLHHLAVATVVWAAANSSAAAQTNTNLNNPVLRANAIGFTGVASDTSPRAPSYPTLINEAIALAKPENKTLFVYYGSSGCGWCHQLHDVMHGKEIEPIISKYFVLVPVTIGEWDDKEKLNNDGADSALTAMGVTSLGTPKFLFLDANGKRIITSPKDNEEAGYALDSVDVADFAARLQKSAPRMTDAERTKVMAYMNAQGDDVRRAMKAGDQKAVDDMNKKAMEARKAREQKS